MNIFYCLQWARDLGEKCTTPVRVPLHACEHFYIVTKAIDGVDRMMPGKEVLVTVFSSLSYWTNYCCAFRIEKHSSLAVVKKEMSFHDKNH